LAVFLRIIIIWVDIFICHQLYFSITSMFDLTTINVLRFPEG